MRLCFVGNPGSIHTQRWVGHFAEAGHQVHLVNLGPQLGRKFDWPGPQHHNLPAQPGVPVPGLRGVLMLTARRRALAALLEQIQPDILHAHAIVDPAWFAALSGFHPLVLTAWGSDVLLGLQQAPWLNRWLTRYALRHADLLTADARVVLDAAQPHLGPATPTALIRFGVDTTRLSAPALTPPGGPGLPSDPTRCCSASASVTRFTISTSSSGPSPTCARSCRPRDWW